MSEIITTDETLAQLKDKVVVVTGGSSGIGLSAVQQLLSIGAKVVNIDQNETVDQLSTIDGAYKFIKASVISWSELRPCFDQAVQAFGVIDHVFANAGKSTPLTQCC